MKGYDSMLSRSLVAARTRLVRITVELSNQIRGLMKTFGLIVPSGKGRNFDTNVRRLLADQAELSGILLPLLNAWHDMRLRAAALTKLLLAVARKSHACRLLMTIPGVGAITATSYATAIDHYSGRVSRRGDRHLRGLLYEAAPVILTRSKIQSDLQTWALNLKAFHVKPDTGLAG